MNKGELIEKVNIAAYLGNNSYNKLGLLGKRYQKAQNSVYGDLTDEEYFLRIESALMKEDKPVKEGQQQEIIVIDPKKEKEFVAKLKAWKLEEVEPNEFTPIEILDPKLLKIAPSIFEAINGVIITCPEEVYLDALDQYAAEIEAKELEFQSKKLEILSKQK
jgi:hypothetical protein